MTNQQGAPEALRVEAAYGGDGKFIGYRLLSSGANGGLLVWADQKAMPGFRIGDHFVPGYQEVIEYKPAALVEAQQPAPSAAAAVGDAQKALNALHYYMTECSGHEPSISVFHRMVEEALAPQPSPTPQADSQPAPVLDYPPLPTRGYTDPDTRVTEQVTPMTFTANEMRAYVDADRAAPPADSVLEDAARYRHLRDCNSGSLVVLQITGTGEDDWHVLTEDDADAAIDAARKQGANHD